MSFLQLLHVTRERKPEHVTEITKEILKISLKFAKMDSIFVEARGCDGTNLCFVKRRRNFPGLLLVSGSKTF